jgi:CHASE2 domain-containing sensor protein
LIAANIVSALVILVRMAGWLQPLELAIYDTLRVAWAGNQPSDRILLVGISESDQQNRWHFPLNDGELAELLDRLASWNPRAIGVDLFRERPVGSGGEQLAAVLARHPEIVWGFTLGGENDLGVPAPEPLRNTPRAVFADIVTDPGNIVRRGLLYAAVDAGKTQMALGVALALRYLRPEGIQPKKESPDLLRLGQSVISRLVGSRGPYVRLDDRGYQILLDYRGGPEPFQRIGMAEVMDRDAASRVRNRVVIIGNVAESVHDPFLTPFSSQLIQLTNTPPTRGMVIHAHLADQLIRAALDGASGLEALSHHTEMIWIWGWAIAGALVGIAVRRPIPALGALLAGLGALAVIVYGAFGMNFLLPALPAGFAWLGSAGLGNGAVHAERYWRDSHGRFATGQVRWAPADMPEGAIFISYAREDLAAVRTLKNSLEAVALTVWFDFDRIGAGDSFDLKIRDNINRCSLFLPVLSRNTEARSEGFFRREWHYAVERAMGIAPEVPFIIPIAVDDMLQFNTLPSRFRELHITVLPEGQVTKEFVARLKQIRKKTEGQDASS